MQVRMNVLVDLLATGTMSACIILSLFGTQDVPGKGQGKGKRSGTLRSEEQPGMAQPVFLHGKCQSFSEGGMPDYVPEKHEA
jgi:hypothetical protein